MSKRALSWLLLVLVVFTTVSTNARAAQSCAAMTAAAPAMTVDVDNEHPCHHQEMPCHHMAGNSTDHSDDGSTACPATCLCCASTLGASLLPPVLPFMQADRQRASYLSWVATPILRYSAPLQRPPIA
jgi:hypothetical protein